VEHEAIAGPIRAYIVDEFLLGSADSFRDDLPLIEAGVVDSMGIMEIVEFVEAEFGIDIAETELVTENFGSVTQMSAFVARKRSGSQALSDEAAC
jgi:acyl carrier protein